jgi:hypothetical protein
MLTMDSTVRENRQELWETWSSSSGNRFDTTRNQRGQGSAYYGCYGLRPAEQEPGERCRSHSQFRQRPDNGAKVATKATAS